MNIRDEAAKATQNGELLVLNLGRKPSLDERQVASVILVHGKVVKNRCGPLGPWAAVKTDLLKQAPLHVVNA